MKTKSILQFVLAFTLLCALFPFTAQQAEAAEDYHLWIGNTKVTQDTLSGAGWAFDPDSNTLTLDGFTYNDKGYCFQVPQEDGSTSDGYACIYCDGEALTIRLLGSNSVKQSKTAEAKYRSGIYAVGDLTIRGEGSLVSDAYNTYYSDCFSYGIYSGGSLIFSGTGSVTALCGEAKGSQSHSYGVCAMNDCVIEGGTLNATGGVMSSRDSESCGVFAKNSVTVNGGFLNAAGGEATGNYSKSYGVYADNSVTVNGGTVTASAGEVKYTSCGICCDKDLFVGGGSVTAKGGSALISSPSGSYGMQIFGDITVSGGTVTAASDKAYSQSYGIFTYGDLTISDGAVTAIGNEADLHSMGIIGLLTNNILITGGTLTAEGGKGSDSFGIKVGYVNAEGGTLTASGGTADKNESCGIYCYGTLSLNGDTSVAATGGTGQTESLGVNVYEILVKDGSLTGKGGTAADGDSIGVEADSIKTEGGTLTATGGTSAGGCCSGISCSNDLLVLSGTVEAEGTDYGIYAKNVISVGGGRVTAAGGDTGGSPSYGMFIESGPLSVSGGIVKATGGKSTASSSCGVFTGNDAVTVSGGTLTATGGAANLNSSGVYTSKDNVVISGGTLTAIGGKAGLDSCGISSQRALKVEGGTLNASGVNYGVYAKNGIAVSDGSVAADGGYVPGGTSCGLYSVNPGASVTVSGGTVYATGGKTDTGSTFGIGTADADVVINGGSVIATGGIADGGLSSGIQSARSIRVQDGTLNSSGGRYGVYAETDIDVSGGEVTVYCGTGSDDHAIHAESGGVAVSGGTVTASGSTGIFTESDTSGDVVISGDGAEVFISSDDCGVDSARDILVSGGRVTVESKFYGLAADGDFKTSGGEVTAKGNYGYGIYALGSVIIDHPTVKIDSQSGSSDAIYADGGIGVREGMKITVPEGGVTDPENGHRRIILSDSDTTPANHAVIEQGLFTLSVAETENGSVTVSPVREHYRYKDAITVTVTPDTGYELDFLTCNGISITGDSFEMPGTDAVVISSFKKIDYSVSVTAQHGTVLAPTSANYGDTVTLTLKADTGYKQDKLTVTDADGKPVTVTDGKFTMPASNVKVTATFKAVSYTVTAAEAVGGAVTPDKTSAKYGDTVTLTIAPDTGYELNTLTVRDAESNIVTVTDGKFTMPASNVKVTATFKAIPHTVSGSFDGTGKLRAKITAPAGSVLIAAAYNADGRPAGVKLIKIDTVCVSKTKSTGLTKQAGCSYKLMLLDGTTFAPLCAAWSGS